MRTTRQAYPRLIASVLLLAAFAYMSRQAEAQVVSGSLVGTVQDTSGGAVAGAAVRIVSASTSQWREALTTEDVCTLMPEPHFKYPAALANFSHALHNQRRGSVAARAL